MKFAVVHPVLPAALTIDDQSAADAQLAELVASTEIPGFVRVVPDRDPVDRDPFRVARHDRGRVSLLPRSARE